MRRKILSICLACMAFSVIGCRSVNSGLGQSDTRADLRQSLVYLQISAYGYLQTQPWKNKDVSENWTCGVAVDKYEVLAPALDPANAAFIKARRYGQNGYINARIKRIDYECGLCLISLDPNTAGGPLKPVAFSEEFPKGSPVSFCWLTPDGDFKTGRGYMDSVRVEKGEQSYGRHLNYVAANISTGTENGQVYCYDSRPIGIACAANDDKQASLIPAETINRFLAQRSAKKYTGFGAVGFGGSELIDPVKRSYLKLPASILNGIYVSNVYTIGTGSDVLKKGDVLLSISGNAVTPSGYYSHPKYGEIHYSYLVTGRPVGERIDFELWRDGKKQTVQAQVKSFDVSEMLVPYYEFDVQPEYIVTGGFVFQKLTGEYLEQWGEKWQGKVSPHLYHYYSDMAFKPGPDRRDIVILSIVLPTQYNLGYHNLRQLVVKKFNGMEIRSIKDILAAQKLEPNASYDVVEFELNYPTVVISREQLPKCDEMVSMRYRIPKLMNVR